MGKRHESRIPAVIQFIVVHHCSNVCFAVGFTLFTLCNSVVKAFIWEFQ